MVMISENVLDTALRDLFDLSPVPFSISTTEHHSRYIKVNPAYLRLIGRTWDEIDGKSLGGDLRYSMDDPARLERMKLLETRGFYELAEVDMLHSSGRVIPTLISAQRRRIGGESLDIEIIIDNSERKSFERAILEAASVDGMTRLQNRSSFEQYLSQALGGLTGENRLVLAYIDLNRFKRVNDGHGHAAGDEVLKAVAARLCDWSGPGDFVARVGGDEFAVASLSSVEEAPSLLRYHDLAARIAEQIAVEGGILQVGAAIGVAEAFPGVSFDGLLDCADRLMYQAKASGQLIDVRSNLTPDAGERR